VRALPSDYETVLRNGVAALRWAEAYTRSRIESAAEPGSLLLQLRNVSGFADRLEHHPPKFWREGFGHFLFTDQDVGVLRDWEERCGVESSPYRSEIDDPDRLLRAADFAALRDFLDWYESHHWELGLPGAERARLLAAAETARQRGL
jgi:hypothetical protein